MESPFVTFLSFARKIDSWHPAAGHTHPQYPLPTNKALINISKKITKLPLTILIELARTMSTGER
jgi:hypothetical protein